MALPSPAGLEPKAIQWLEPKWMVAEAAAFMVAEAAAYIYIYIYKKKIYISTRARMIITNIYI